MNTELTEKTERLVRLLAAEKLGGVLLNAQHNFAWLTGGKANIVNSSGAGGECFLFVRRDGKRFVLANNIEMPRLLAEEISQADFEPIEFAWQAEKSSDDFIVGKAKSLLEENSAVGSDLFLNLKIKPLENLVARCRYQLTAEEIARYRRLGRDCAQAVSDLFAAIKLGETELEIAHRAKNQLMKFNIDPVVTLIGADERIAKFRHPVPTGNRWRKILLVVVCGRREGLIANLSRLACAGQMPDELKIKTEAVSRIHAQILAQTQPGKSGAALYQTLKNAYDNEGFIDEIYLHHQGGATGYTARDWTAHPAASEIVKTNQAFAWNPSLTGTKSEETVLIGENAVEILTTAPDFPSIETGFGRYEFALPGILQL